MKVSKIISRTINIYFFITNKYDYILSVVSTILVILFYIYLEHKYNLYIHIYTRIIFYIAALCNNLLGEYLGLYTKSFIFDKILHVFGTYALTIFAYTLLNQILEKPLLSKSIEFTFIVMIGISIGVFFEIIEFLSDIITKPQVPSQSGLIDTDLDLIFDVLGSIISSLHLIFTNFKLAKIPHAFKGNPVK